MRACCGAKVLHDVNYIVKEGVRIFKYRSYGMLSGFVNTLGWKSNKIVICVYAIIYNTKYNVTQI